MSKRAPPLEHRPPNLADIEARLNAATPGPWVTGQHASNDTVIEAVNGGMTIYDEGGHGPADAQFIAHAPEDIAALLREVEALRTALRPSDTEVARITQALFEVAPNAPLFDNVPSDMRWGELVRAVAELLRVGAPERDLDVSGGTPQL